MVREQHRREREAAEERAHQARVQRATEEVQLTAQTTGQIASTFEEGAREFGLGVGAEMVASGIQDSADAASYAAPCWSGLSLAGGNESNRPEAVVCPTPRP